jgi:flagellar motor switch protein FliN
MTEGISGGISDQPGDFGMFSEQSGGFGEKQARGMEGMPGANGILPPNLPMLMDVNMQVTVELGRTNMTVRQVLELQKGSVVELDRIAGDAVDIFVNNRLMAKGDVVVVDDKFGVRITELISPARTGSGE